MILKKIILKNFQKHSNLELDFTSGVNIICGATQAGKSCIRRAISWVINNDIHGDAIRKQGTKKTEVTLVTDNDIKVTRIKSKTVNSYTIEKDGKEQKFESFGRNVPEEITNIFQMPNLNIESTNINLNIADQIAMPLLLGKNISGIFRNKLFNKITGAEISDQVLKDFNKDILNAQRNKKLTEENLTKFQEELQNKLKIKKDIEIKYKDISNLLENIERKIKLYETCMRYESKDKDKANLNKKLKDYQVKIDFEYLLNKGDKYKELSNMIDVLKTSKNQKLKIQNRLDNLKQLINYPIQKMILQSDKLLRLINMKKLFNKKTNIKESLKESSLKLSNWIKKYKKELISRKICPTCKQTISEETIKDLKC